ncbi:hypothetical protein AYO20_00652 [Fonsecaea nubica]|uniref:Uncharacterized protein n=1 Tax=Fonsecaea nubica TaxID=856822 RepID=A0A178DEX4_9EURO|nr:hypothetical protein AYO20_00652 [Fonsecaea nubica]OAL40232.1 hypothetical protein AYO20_00652 [Fonsecaea nubica]
MRNYIEPLALFICLISNVKAFKVSFYKNTNCAGEFLGTWVGGEGQGCRQEYAGLAEGVVVESTGSVDDFTTVQFYTSDDCTPGTEVSQADVGCLTVDQAVVGAYKSFQVIHSSPLASNSASRRRSPINRRYPFPLASTTETVPPPPTIYHGMELSFDGTSYKLHQIHANGYIGILPDEWDDAIHTMNNAELVPYGLFPNITGREVDQRDLVSSLCETFATCVSAAAEHAVSLRDALVPYFNRVRTAAQARGQTAFEFLKGPFFQQVAVDTVAGLAPAVVGGVVQAVVGAQVAGNTNNAASCSQEKDQIDALISIVQSQISALDAASAKITAQQNDAGDEVFTVTVTVVACGTSLVGANCGVPASFCPS